jgi:hypothetical protein
MPPQPQDADAFTVNERLRAKEIYRCAKIFGIDVRRKSCELKN